VTRLLFETDTLEPSDEPVPAGARGAKTRKKRAPKEYPVEPELTEILRDHRQRMLRDQAKGLEAGWMFPSTEGTLRTPNSLDRAERTPTRYSYPRMRSRPHTP